MENIFSDSKFREAINLIFGDTFSQCNDKCGDNYPIPDLISFDEKIIIELGTLSGFGSINHDIQDISAKRLEDIRRRMNELFAKYTKCEEIWWIPYPRKEHHPFYHFSIFRFKRTLIASMETMISERDNLKSEISNLTLKCMGLRQVINRILHIKKNLFFEINGLEDDIKSLQDENIFF